MELSLMAKQAREYLFFHIQKYGQKIREHGQDLGGLMAPGLGIDIPLPPYSSEKEKFPLHAELISHISHGIWMYAEAVERGYKPNRFEQVLITCFEMMFNERQHILNKIRREVNKIGREHGYDELPSLRLKSLDQKGISEIRGQVLENLVESIDPANSWKQGKPPEIYEKACEHEEKLREIIDKTFASPELIDLQRFPYPRGSVDYLRELQTYIANYFERFGRISCALKEKGVDIENLHLS